MHDELELVDQSELDEGEGQADPAGVQPSTGLRLELADAGFEVGGSVRASGDCRAISAFQSTRSRVWVTTYFLAPSMVRAKGRIQSSTQSAGSPAATGRQASSIIW